MIFFRTNRDGTDSADKRLSFGMDVKKAPSGPRASLWRSTVVPRSGQSGRCPRHGQVAQKVAYEPGRLFVVHEVVGEPQHCGARLDPGHFRGGHAGKCIERGVAQISRTADGGAHHSEQARRSPTITYPFSRLMQKRYIHRATRRGMGRRQWN